MTTSMLNKWNYGTMSQVCYSDPQCESYKKAAKFLGDDVEDWGGGTGWAKRYFKNYRNVDGSKHKNVDEQADLVNYISDVDNILMRQVLELNEEWEKILDNAIKSFRKKMCLIIFTPFADETKIIDRFEDKVAISFKKTDILNRFGGFRVREETIKTNQGYGQDWILYIEK